MKHASKIIFCLLFLANYSFGQKLDTLKILVLSPNTVEIADNYLAEYDELNKKILDSRNSLKKERNKRIKEELKELEGLPSYTLQDYTKQMFENELKFYDSLTIDNYVSMVVREYISYRLYRPFKIKPRLVFVEPVKLKSDLVEYSKLSKGEKNLFIVNFPTIKFYKEDGELKVSTKLELYSSSTNEILLIKENIGLAKGGLTDYPMCSGDNWDCAIVNSVYPSLYDILRIIVERQR